MAAPDREREIGAILCDPGVRSQCDWCHLNAILGCNLGEVEGLIWALGSPVKSKGAIWVRFEVKVER